MVEKTNFDTVTFSPCDELKAYLHSCDQEASLTLNHLFRLYSVQIKHDSIELTPKELSHLVQYTNCTFIDEKVVVGLAENLMKYDSSSLVEKINNATFGQRIATLLKYEII
jgi:hypothetical protein